MDPRDMDTRDMDTRDMDTPGIDTRSVAALAGRIVGAFGIMVTARIFVGRGFSRDMEQLLRGF